MILILCRYCASLYCVTKLFGVRIEFKVITSINSKVSDGPRESQSSYSILLQIIKCTAGMPCPSFSHSPCSLRPVSSPLWHTRNTQDFSTISINELFVWLLDYYLFFSINKKLHEKWDHVPLGYYNMAQYSTHIKNDFIKLMYKWDVTAIGHWVGERSLH